MTAETIPYRVYGDITTGTVCPPLFMTDYANYPL